MRIRSTFAAACAAILAAVTLQADADTLQVQNPRDPSLCMTASLGSVYWQKCDANADNQRLPYTIQTGPTKPPVVLPVDPPASTPTPATGPVDQPKTDPEPSGTPSSSTVPLGPITRTKTDSYWSKNVGDTTALNNVWGAGGLTGEQAVGIQAASNGGVDCRIKWAWPAIGREVISYPECTYGRSASVGPVGGAKLPRPAAALSQLTTSVQRIDGGGTGFGHVVYDLWTSDNPANLGAASRRAEIMLPVIPFGCYGIPNYPAAAAAGRDCAAGGGRNPSGFKGRENIGGNTYDVYYFPANSPATKLRWQFIVFVPLRLAGAGAHTIDWMPLVRYMRGKGWITDGDYMSSVELGVEPVGNGRASAGDVTIRGMKVQVQ